MGTRYKKERKGKERLGLGLQKCGDNAPAQLRPKLTSVAYLGKAVERICGIVGVWGPINARMPPPLRFCGELTMELFDATSALRLDGGEHGRWKRKRRKRHRIERLMIRLSLKTLTKGERKLLALGIC